MSKKLLATKKQTKWRLVRRVKGKTCFCVEGLIALAIGGVAYEDLEEICINSEHLTYGLNSEHFTGILFEIPRKLIIENAAKLELSSYQIDCLKSNDSVFMSWIHLNDTINLTFPQFSKLLELI